MAGGRLNKKGRNKYPTFIMLRYDVHDSPAYLSLKPEPRCVLQEIRRRYNGHNNGQIPLSCREAADLCNIGKTTAADAFDELLEKGFIAICEEAGFNQKGGRRSRRWRLTEETYNGQPPTAEWRKWKPPEI